MNSDTLRRRVYPALVLALMVASVVIVYLCVELILTHRQLEAARTVVPPVCKPLPDPRAGYKCSLHRVSGMEYEWCRRPIKGDS